MTTRGLAVVVFVVAAGAGCTMTKEECSSKYNLMPKDEAACLSAFSTLTKPVSPTPGPKIIVKKQAGIGGDFLEWKVDNVLQPAGGNVWHPSNPVPIRSDFKGTSIMDFGVHTVSNQSFTNVNYVVFQTKNGADVYTVEMIRTANNVMRWYLSKNGMRRQMSADNNPSTSVPTEFTYPLVVSPQWSFREEVEEQDLDAVDFLRVAL